MPYLRSSYYRGVQVLSSAVSGPPSEELTVFLPSHPTDEGIAAVAPSLTQYYVDESPSNVTVYDEEPLSNNTEGSLYVSWTDRTGGLRHHRVYYRERFSASSLSWWLAAQYEPSRTTGVIQSLLQSAGYDVGVRSVDTADNFLSQITYVIHTLSFDPS
jgi:hypothetical protein